MTRIDGKVAIITGGARGQGKATAGLFVERGATVYLTDIDAAEGRRAAQETGATFVEHDVTRQESWTDVVALVMGEAGKIDVLVNNAGIIEWHTMMTTSLDVWHRVLAVNQTGPLLGMQAVAPHMIAQRSGSIVNISSTGGLGGAPACYAYSATKWALRGMSRGAAKELGRHGVRVNAIMPGAIDTRMIAGQDHDEMRSRIPLGRIAEPVEVSRLSLWLASDDSLFATGGEFTLDGGSTA